MISKKQFLQKTEEHLETALDPGLGGNPPAHSQMLSEALDHVRQGKAAKRARPQLTWFFGQALAPDRDFSQIGAAAELIHTASLLHDDVIDNGTTRRGLKTVNKVFGDKTAVLAGDYMLTRSLKLIQDFPAPVWHSAIEVIEEMTVAAILEVEARRQTRLTWDYWRRIARGKTGVLFGWCGQAPALAAQNAAAAEAFAGCGRHLGVAFQIADDLKDFYGKDSGKQNYIDLINKNPNLILLTAAGMSHQLEAKIHDYWQREDWPDTQIRQFGEELRDSGAVQEALELMEKEIQTAIGFLDDFRFQTGIEDLRLWIEQLYKGFSGGKVPLSLLWSKIKHIGRK